MLCNILSIESIATERRPQRRGGIVQVSLYIQIDIDVYNDLLSSCYRLLSSSVAL